MITFINIILVALITGSIVLLITRRIFWSLTRKDFRSKGKTPSFYQMEDPYIARLVENLYENKNTLREN